MRSFFLVTSRRAFFLETSMRSFFQVTSMRPFFLVTRMRPFFLVTSTCMRSFFLATTHSVGRSVGQSFLHAETTFKQVASVAKDNGLGLCGLRCGRRQLLFKAAGRQNALLTQCAWKACNPCCLREMGVRVQAEIRGRRKGWDCMMHREGNGRREMHPLTQREGDGDDATWVGWVPLLG